MAKAVVLNQGNVASLGTLENILGMPQLGGKEGATGI